MRSQTNKHLGVIYLGDMSIIKEEKECLINSGSFLKINRIQKVNEKCILSTSGWFLLDGQDFVNI